MAKTDAVQNFVQTEPRTVLDVVAAAAQDPNIDPAKMSALLDMQLRILEVEREKAFNLALAKLQGEMPTITKHGKADRYKFARYEDIDAALRPLLTEHGFSYIFVETEEKGRYKGTLLHKDGHSMSGYFEAQPDKSGSKNDIQAIGSARSYARRFIFTGLLNIVTINEDDDAQSFSYINAVQVAEIEKMLTDFEVDTPRFLKQTGVDSIPHIPSKMFETVIRALNQRNAKKALAEGVKE